MPIPKRLEGVHYLHLRHHDTDGFILNQGGQTLAWEVVDQKDNLFKIRLGRAICSEKDNFWRKRGRDLAKERMENPTRITNYFGKDLNAEITTMHTLKEDIHTQLFSWAYKV